MEIGNVHEAPNLIDWIGQKDVAIVAQYALERRENILVIVHQE